jgi:hypothetical protein
MNYSLQLPSHMFEIRMWSWRSDECHCELDCWAPNQSRRLEDKMILMASMVSVNKCTNCLNTLLNTSSILLHRKTSLRLSRGPFPSISRGQRSRTPFIRDRQDGQSDYLRRQLPEPLTFEGDGSAAAASSGSQSQVSVSACKLIRMLHATFSHSPLSPVILRPLLFLPIAMIQALIK